MNAPMCAIPRLIAPPRPAASLPTIRRRLVVDLLKTQYLLNAAVKARLRGEISADTVAFLARQEAMLGRRLDALDGVRNQPAPSLVE